MNATFPERHALVTGVSSEVGLAIAATLAGQGYVVHGTSRSAIGAGADVATHYPGDLSGRAFRESLVEALPPIHALVHAAGHRFEYKRFHQQTHPERDAIWSLEVHAFEDLVAGLIEGMMAARFGRIVAIGSLAARLAGPGATTYTAAKAAVAGFTRGLAVDYGRFQVTANVVAPGAIDNARLHTRLSDDAALRALAQKAALKRLVTPSDVAGAVGFLTGPTGAAITGQTLTVAAGMDLQGAW